MPAVDLLYLFQGLSALVVGAYFLAFRPLDRRAAWFGVAAFLFGVGGVARLWTEEALRGAWVLATAAFLVFAFLFPQRLRWRSFAGVTWTLAAAMWVATTLYWLTGQVPFAASSPPSNPATIPLQDRVFSPFSLGTAATLVLLGIGRLVSMGPDIPERDRQATPYLLLLLTAGVFTGGGFELGHVVGGLAGRTDYPFFFYKSAAGIGYTIIAGANWWVWPGLFAALAAWRLRCWTPTLLIAAGFLSYMPILWRPGLDLGIVITLRLWGLLLSPALAMYAQSRWAPFEGEPTRVSAGWAMAVVAGLMAYAFVFVATSALAGDGDAAGILAPVLGLAAAVGVATLALPRARKMHLQRLFTLAAQDRFSPGALVLGRYRITRLLGEGGQGRVYEATDRKHGNAKVVLKAVTSDEAVHEARILKGLVHPNIVRFVDVVEVPGFTLLVLEFADGGTLRGLLSRKSGRLAGAEAATLLDGILSGLSQAHSQGVVHRDIKPENILLSDGVPKLADFGVAHPGAVGTTIRVGGRGTLAYLSPEQVRGAPGDARSDVYSMGVLVHEVLTGHPPIATAADDFQVRQAILTKPAKVDLAPSQARVAAVLRKALAKDPAGRYGDAAELRAHLKAAWPA